MRPPTTTPTSPRPAVALAAVWWAAALGAATVALHGRASDVVYHLAVWPTLAVLLWRTTRPGVAAAWRLMAGGLVCFATGDLAWNAIEWSGAVPDASWADLVYLSGYVLLAAGVALLLRDHGGRSRRDGLVDGLLLAVPAVVLLGEFLVVPGWREAETLLERAVAAGYPLADTLLLAALVWLLVTPGLPRRATVPLAAGTVATLAVDVTWAAASLRGDATVVRLAEACFPATYALLAVGIAAGAGAPVEDRPEQPGPHVPWGRVALLAAGLVAAPLAAVLGVVLHHQLHPALVVAATVVAAALVVVRFARLVNDLNRTTQELTSARNEILEQAVRDPLTGMFNRGVLADRLAGLGEGRVGSALLSIDLDRFKAVNDAHGHAAGDAVLEAVAERIWGCTRESDAVIRMGGDEFLVVVHDVDPDTADELAHRIVRSVERPIPFGDVELQVSASVGVALVPPGAAAGTEELLHDADVAMYGAKRGGGRGVRLARR